MPHNYKIKNLDLRGWAIIKYFAFGFNHFIVLLYMIETSKKNARSIPYIIYLEIYKRHDNKLKRIQRNFQTREKRENRERERERGAEYTDR